MICSILQPLYGFVKEIGYLELSLQIDICNKLRSGNYETDNPILFGFKLEVSFTEVVPQFNHVVRFGLSIDVMFLLQLISA